MPVAPEVAQTLSQHSDLELQAILASPDDWQPDALAFARGELERRSVPPEQVAKGTADIAEKLRLKALLPPTSSETAVTVLCSLIGCISILIIAIRASRFEQAGYTLKARKTWQAFLVTIAVGLGFILGLALLGGLLGRLLRF